MLFPKLHVHQRVLLVPGTFGCSNLSYFPIEGQARNVVDKLEGYFQWMKAEPRIAGFNPWYTRTTSTQYPLYSRLGDGFIGDLNRCVCHKSINMHFNNRSGAQSGGACDMSLGAISMPSVVAKLKEIGDFILKNSVMVKAEARTNA
jgi:hypothetical protein